MENSNDSSHQAAHMVSFVLRHALSNPPKDELTRLGFVCLKVLWMTERASLSRLVQLESLVSERYNEEKRAIRALARERRRLERDVRRVEEKRAALEAYHNVLNSPAEQKLEEFEVSEDLEEELTSSEKESSISKDDEYDGEDDDENEEEEELDKEMARRAVNIVLNS